MPRNFGVRRNLLGGEMYDGLWNEEPPAPRDPLWPYVVVGVTVVSIIVWALFAK